jgi:hypothetical protein
MDVAKNLRKLYCRCYACDEFVTSDVSRKLKECIELLQRQQTTGTNLQLLLNVNCVRTSCIFCMKA